MRIIMLGDFITTLHAQGVPSRQHFAFKCPMCETVQSAVDLIAAGAGADFESVEKYLGYSCVGRFTGKTFTKESKGAGVGCDWTLGGAFKMHTLEVFAPGDGTGDTEYHPHFEPASPAEAQALYIKHQKRQQAARISA